MSEKTLSELENLNYRMLSFIDTIIQNEKNSIDRGKHILMKESFMNEFNDILNKNKKLTITKKRSNEPITELEIIIPESDEEPINLVNSDDDFLNVMIGGWYTKNQPIDNEPANNVNDIVDVDSDSLMELLDNEIKIQQGGDKKPKSILKKRVQINAIDNEPKTKIVTKKEKLESKLNAAWAEEIKSLGKTLGLKPPKNKKSLSKTDVTKKILANPKLYDKALKELNKSALLRSDTASDSN